MNGLSKKRRLKNRYDKTAGIYSDRYEEIQIKKFQAIQPYLKRVDRVLDVGCGTGLFLDKLSEISEGIIGIDFSLSTLGEAKKHSDNALLVCADADRLPFRDRVFDAVISLTLLQNMPDPQYTIEEMERVIVEDGLLILTTLEKKHSVKQLEEWVYSANLKPMQIGRIPDSEDIFCVARRMK